MTPSRTKLAIGSALAAAIEAGETTRDALAVASRSSSSTVCRWLDDCQHHEPSVSQVAWMLEALPLSAAQRLWSVFAKPFHQRARNEARREMDRDGDGKVTTDDLVMTEAELSARQSEDVQLTLHNARDRRLSSEEAAAALYQISGKRHLLNVTELQVLELGADPVDGFGRVPVK